MSDGTPITAILPGRLMHRALKADVIAYLAAAPLPPARRRKLYRRWCEYVNDKPKRHELELIAPSKPRERQEGLPW